VCRVSSSKGGCGGRAVLEKGSETSVYMYYNTMTLHGFVLIKEEK